MKDEGAVFSCGPSSQECKCECFTGGPCGHIWDGPIEAKETEDEGYLETATCSKCGMTAISHDMWVGP